MGAGADDSPYMSSLLLERKEERFATEFGVFARGVEENATRLGVTAPEAAALLALGENLESALGAVAAAKAALAAAVEAKEAVLRKAREAAGERSAQFRANPSVDDALLAELGLAPKRVAPTKKGPVTPEKLTLEAGGDGQISLGWDRAGGPRGTLFLIQRADSPNGPWETVEVTTRSRAKVNATPGQAVWLRVVAKIRDQVSAPSLPASVWARELRQAA